MAYTYDEAGNRNSLTVTGTENYVTNYYIYDDKKYRLLKTSKKNSGADYIDVTDYTYDNNGNQIRTDSSRQGLTPKFEIGLYAPDEDSGYGYEMFTYNGLNQLVKYEDEMSNKAEYTYMANGLRLSKTVNGDKTSFLWDGDQIMATITSDETRSYTRAPGYIRTGTSKERSSLEKNDKFYLFNGHGDVTGITDKSGNLEKSYEYDAFGNEINPSKNDTNPFRYCSEYYDEETESIYLRARYYNPSTGRFTAEDPIKDGLNWYAYCGGNPVALVDPSGLSGSDVMVRYIAEKNKGTATPNYDKSSGKVNSVTVSINDIEHTYNVGNGEGDIRIINGRAVMNSDVLMHDFMLFPGKAVHNEGDLFDSVDDAALAFALTYFGKSTERTTVYPNGVEYVCCIYTKWGRTDKYYFDDVVKGSATKSPAPKPNKNKSMAAWAHTHGAYIKNDKYSDYFSGEYNGGGDAFVTNELNKDGYLVTPGGVLKCLDRDVNISGRTYIMDNDPSVRVVASGILK